MTYCGVQTFWLEPTDQVAWGLRRYVGGSGGFTCETGFHDALVYPERLSSVFAPVDRHRSEPDVPPVADDDPRWPAQCDRCDYRFTDADARQPGWTERIYRRPDTGEEYVLHPNAGAGALGAPSAPPGAMWDAWWMPFMRGPDGICLMVRLPNDHDWMVDSEASNCTRKGEPHQCWCRHGDPRTQPVTVDKQGDTCAAGAGSILSGDYHGFLTAGRLTDGC